MGTPTPPPGDPIPLKTIDGLTSLNATVNIQVNGLIDGKRAQGELEAELTSNDKNQSKISVTGPLLGDIVAQVGGSLVSLFTPKAVDIYKTPEGTFIVLNGFFPVCVKPQAANTYSGAGRDEPEEPAEDADQQRRGARQVSWAMRRSTVKP